MPAHEPSLGIAARLNAAPFQGSKLHPGPEVPAEKSDAIVLRTTDFSETSLVVTLFTRDFGKITGLAKGARRRNGPFESALDVLSLIRVVFLHKNSEAMDLLTEAKLERRFRSAGKDLERLYGAYYVVELLNGLTDNGDPNPELFELASQTLCELDEGPESPFRTCLRFEFAMLQMVGHTPMLNQCVYCGEEMSDEKRVFFGALAGGLICPRCRPGKTGVISLSKQAWNLMSNFLSSEEEQVREEHEPFESSQRNVGGIAEVRETMNQFVSHLLGRRPRLQAYLKVPVSDPTTRRDNKKRLSHVSATNSRMTGNRQPRAQDESSP